MSWFLVAAGGAFGALSRYAIDRAVTAYIGPNVLGIFLINIIGSFLLGIFVTAYDAHDWPMSTRLLIAVGFFGSYTTFSTLTVASVQLAQGGDMARAALNIMGSIAIGLVAAFAGILVGRAL
ncbi:MAG: CrcB family protein [Dehalococcoidia bacterium]|nr:CrcB family protein [Dehalococcoidia bacterium]